MIARVLNTHHLSLRYLDEEARKLAEDAERVEARLAELGVAV